MKQKPRQSNMLARMEPRIAARITGTFWSLPVTNSTMKRTISTTDPSVVSAMTPSTLGNLRASSEPQKPTVLAAGIMAMKLVTKMAR
jgi:hypothetical protein